MVHILLHQIYALHAYHIACMIRRVNIRPWHRFQYSYVCSNAMSVDPEGPGSTRSVRISLISAGVGPGLVKLSWMWVYPTVCRGMQQVVIGISVCWICSKFILGWPTSAVAKRRPEQSQRQGRSEADPR